MIKKATNVQYSYIISGNGIQNGNPSPSNILPFDGCGDKTGNLLDYTTVENTSNATAAQISDGISVSGRYYVQFKTVKFTVGSSYTMSWTAKTISGTVTTMWRFHYSDNTYSSMPSSGGSLVVEKEVVALLLYVNTRSTESGVVELTNIMLNIGSTPRPYKPYGYVLPIEYDNNISASIYLGQVQTTRNIKKLVLTGQEDWNMPYTSIFRLNLNGYLRDANNIVVCTHYKGIAPVSTVDDVGMNETALLLSSSGNNYFYIHDNRTNLNTFTTYLQQQYSAGTPVTVWYVLATPEVSITNEPLMKIGNYVDTINNTQSGIDITTNNLIVNTTIPPSDISISTSATWVPIPYNKYNTETISTIAPIDFLSNGQDITVGVKGNVEQLEIPSPQNPAMPEGTGDKTENLFDKVFASGYNLSSNGNPVAYQGDSRCATLEPVDVSNVNNVTFSFVNTASGMKNFIYSLFNGSSLVTRVAGGQSGDTIDVSLGDKLYLCVYSNLASVNAAETTTNIMLNEGSTPLPYEPYGYKLDISSANTTTPVYLGEVQSVRAIKKKVFDGSENWRLSGGNLYSDAIDTDALVNQVCKCTHFTSSGSAGIYVSVGANRLKLFSAAFPEGVTNATTMKSWVAQQYNNGTPLVVYYILATPQTAVVNEPLMKIGDYADEVSGISIPTTKGSNTLSINTSVQPSNVQVSISGWVPHNNIKEYKNNAWMATSWEGFRDIVRAGNGPTRYPIGTKLYETWGDNTSNAWIIVDYDNSNYSDPDISALGYTHNVVLYEEKINYLKVFDNTEAWLYTESVLPAGTYRFTIPNYDTTYGGNKTYIFTSTVDVPIHGQLTLSWPYQQNPVSVSAYTTNTSTTALFTATVTEWDGTTTSEDLGTIKLAMTDPDSTYGKLNHIHRARYGSNNYYQSGIRQWMNADATANNWWKPTNIFDRPYSNRTSDGGLYLMDKDFRKVIAAPNITCITNNIFETGTSGSTAFKLQTQYTIRDKIFLPTHTELNLSSNPNIGTVFSQYTNAGNDDRIKYRKDNGNAYYYWFRTPYPSFGYNVRGVTSSGALSGDYALNTRGAVRACIIQ